MDPVSIVIGTAIAALVNWTFYSAVEEEPVRSCNVLIQEDPAAWEVMSPCPFDEIVLPTKEG